MRLPKSGASTGSNVVVAFNRCPAKTLRTEQGVTVGRSVENHCVIVGCIARELISRYPSELAGKLFPQGAELIAAAHDIGKVSPTFYEKIRRACDQNLVDLPALNGINPNWERDWGGHAGVSQLAAKALGVPEYIPEILGQHHGFSPQLAGSQADGEKFGGPSWQAQRAELVAVLKQTLGVDWPQIDTVARSRLLAGLTSVADWIGSGRFFEQPHLPWQENIKKAVDDAGFIPPTFRPALDFYDIFGFSPRPAQQQLIEQVSQPGVYVLEAPTGLGKTEAALYAAYQLLLSKQATGIYFALPTQLTSNKIHERFSEFLERILATDCDHRSLLLHANAWLTETEMGEEGRPGGAWFCHAKRGLLAPFAVGTLDQALMAAMNVKHGFVRAFGLAGKVVILDEVHTYDAYTGTLLDALIALLRELHCTVIILTATLNRDRRQQLLAEPVSSDAYPLITVFKQSGSCQEITVPAPPSSKFALHLELEPRLAVEEALERAAGGEQVLWIENTVIEAQSRYLDLAARAADMGVGCGLLHSRFTAHDRQAIEQTWVDRFGKSGWQERVHQGCILVGTPVLEQSLDIDADFLVSRFAPSDMLIQRLGRLWRHEAAPRPTTAKREAWLLVADLDEAIAAPVKAFGKTAFVYSPYVLCRSLEVWQSKTLLRLPADVRELIEATYVARPETGAMRRWLDELQQGTSRRKGTQSLQQLAGMALSQAGKTLPETKAQTRYSEVDNLDLLLLRRIEQIPHAATTRLTLLDGSRLDLPHQRLALGKKQWRELTCKLMREQLSVKIQDAPTAVSIDVLKRYCLQHCFYLGESAQDEALLRVALVDETGRIKSLDGQAVHDKYQLEYRDDFGYQVIKDQEV